MFGLVNRKDLEEISICTVDIPYEPQFMEQVLESSVLEERASSWSKGNPSTWHGVSAMQRTYHPR